MVDTDLPGIYEIVRVETGDRYIGSSVNIRRRWSQHKHDLRKGKHETARLQNAWNKYGESAFAFLAIDNVPAQELIGWEQFYLDHASHMGANNVYNTSKVTGSPLGVKRSEETKAKLSEIGKKNRGKPKPPRTPEHSEKIASANRGRTPYNKGKKASDETKAKLRERLIARSASPEARAKLSEMSKRAKEIRWSKPGEKERASEFFRKRMADPCIREAHSRAMTEYWARPGVKEKVGAAHRLRWAIRRANKRLVIIEGNSCI